MPGDMLGLKPGRQRYTLLTNEAGGILDDLMVANLGGERLFLVVNASRKDDRLHPHRRQPAVRRAASSARGSRPAGAAGSGRGRGDRAASAPEAAQLPFMGVAAVTLAGIPCLVSRSGYTGEDGFEISVPADTRRGGGAAHC